MGVADNELDIEQEYPFTVETMPVADGITDGRLEIRLEIQPEGLCRNRRTLRFSSRTARERLKMEDGAVLKKKPK
ncbi:DUF3872 domain-containing protein [Bacteroides thetaiotaomicron]|nr:DUF3872 domain-containing protein [Bacteroides thetaiotaomicron]